MVWDDYAVASHQGLIDSPLSQEGKALLTLNVILLVGAYNHTRHIEGMV